MNLRWPEATMLSERGHFIVLNFESLPVDISSIEETPKIGQKMKLSFEALTLMLPA